MVSQIKWLIFLASTLAFSGEVNFKKDACVVSIVQDKNIKLNLKTQWGNYQTNFPLKIATEKLIRRYNHENQSWEWVEGSNIYILKKVIDKDNNITEFRATIQLEVAAVDVNFTNQITLSSETIKKFLPVISAVNVEASVSEYNFIHPSVVTRKNVCEN